MPQPFTFPPFTAERRAALSAALRSGKYKQGRFALRRADNTYCCLGVYADICGVEWHLYKEVGKYVFAAADEASGMLILGTVISPGAMPLMHILIHMNDDKEKSFAEIADFVDTLPVVETEDSAQ